MILTTSSTKGPQFYQLSINNDDDSKNNDFSLPPPPDPMRNDVNEELVPITAKAFKERAKAGKGKKFDRNDMSVIVGFVARSLVDYTIPTQLQTQALMRELLISGEVRKDMFDLRE